MASYQQLLSQVAARDLPNLLASWASVQQIIASTPSTNVCGGIGGPASLVGPLQQISDQACSIAHNAAVAALGYTVNCAGVGAESALNAQNATKQACVLQYSWMGPNYGPYGTTFASGNPSGTCLDPAFTSAVGAQVAAAQYAVAQAQAVASACAAATQANLAKGNASGAALATTTTPTVILRPGAFTALSPVRRLS